jgi:hypothetical protein
MAGAKLIIIFPWPTDVEVFEKFYQQEHLSNISERMMGMVKAVTITVKSSPQGVLPFYRITEISFPSNEYSRSQAGF